MLSHEDINQIEDTEFKNSFLNSAKNTDFGIKLQNFKIIFISRDVNHKLRRYFGEGSFWLVTSNTKTTKHPNLGDDKVNSLQTESKSFTLNFDYASSIKIGTNSDLKNQTIAGVEQTGHQDYRYSLLEDEEPLSEDDARFVLSFYNNQEPISTLPPVFVCYLKAELSYNAKVNDLPSIDDILKKAARIQYKSAELKTLTMFSTAEVVAENISDALLFSNPPTSSSHFLLDIKTVYGGNDPENYKVTEELRSEIELLIDWVSIINKCEKNQHEFESWKCDSKVLQEKENVSVKQLAVEFIEDLNEQGNQFGTIPLSSKSNSELLEPQVLPKRSDFDFTDLLFPFILKNCTLQEHLIQTLSVVAEKLKSGSLKPLIYKQNTSTLAAVIRDYIKLCRTTMSIKEAVASKDSIESTFEYWLLSEDNPHSILECFVEVGINKLKKDFLFLLLGNEISNFSQLEFFFESSIPLIEQTLRLFAVFRIVEIINFIKTNLAGLSLEIIRELTIKISDYFKEILDKFNRDKFDDKINEDIKKSEIKIFEEFFNLNFNFKIFLPRFNSNVNKMVEGIFNSRIPCTYGLTFSFQNGFIFKYSLEKKQYTDYEEFENEDFKKNFELHEEKFNVVIGIGTGI
ncbi:hypothetical protein HK099_006951 [Clydaea vesicula]|uniref:Uncharacterized protein n=1 Tax=Clydaea vesicula TaxID=447962 RepID=A0AAD5TXU4_9FUNG|nr:hypothetical protein HK099_006951 [Clydaea vesicula]